MYQQVVSCPSCGTGILISSELESLQKATVALAPQAPVRVQVVDQSRDLTPHDRGEIIRAQLTGWLKESKQALASRLGLSQAKISAVIAWTRDSMGGKEYIRKWAKE